MARRFSKLLLLVFSAFLISTCCCGPSVYVMLPLDLFNANSSLLDPQKLTWQLRQLQQVGVEGVNTDVWWGLVERGPQRYDWSGYLQLVNLIRSCNLKLKITFSFHSCGMNVGDSCYIPLPQFVLNVGKNQPDIFYKDQHGHYDEEYLSLGVDNQTLFNGRSAVQMYQDFMSSFESTFRGYIGSVITHIQVGLGPAGELRYPSYQLDRWSFPGVGEFQCYDEYMLADLKAYAASQGHPEWGHGGPNNAGSYNSKPYETAFFNNGFDNFRSPYGQFFLTWYTNKLINHGRSVLSAANNVFDRREVVVEAKVSGIHWWYSDPSHAAELTAGYKNDDGKGYSRVLDMFKSLNVSLVFTCFEMRNSEQSGCNCASDPEDLVRQTLVNTQAEGTILYSAENALERYDDTAYNTILWESSRVFVIHSFSYLRLTDTLFQGGNLNTFQSFVQKMKGLGQNKKVIAANMAA